MAEKQITVRLVGADEDRGEVRFEDFRAFCDNVAKCLRRSEVLVTGKTGKVRYRITELGTGSAVMTLEPISTTNGKRQRSGEKVVTFFKKTVNDLQLGRRIDPRLTPHDLSEFRELVASPKKTKEIWIDGERITTQFLANIEKIIGATVPSEGSVSGFLEGLNLHNRNEFILYPPIAGYRVYCQFPDEMFRDVKRALKQNVTVTGTLYYHPEGPFPDRVQVAELVAHPSDSELPTLRDLKGILHGCTKGKSAVEFVRVLRDE